MAGGPAGGPATFQGPPGSNRCPRSASLSPRTLGKSPATPVVTARWESFFRKTGVLWFKNQSRPVQGCFGHNVFPLLSPVFITTLFMLLLLLVRDQDHRSCLPTQSSVLLANPGCPGTQRRLGICPPDGIKVPVWIWSRPDEPLPHCLVDFSGVRAAN